MANVSPMSTPTADNPLKLEPAPGSACAGSGLRCQNTTTPARASPTMAAKPTHNTTVQTHGWADRPEAASSTISLPRKPGRGGSPAADAAPNSNISPSSMGSRTDTAGVSLSAAAPRCAATSSTSKNSAAITTVLCSM